jgi:hypothetical protein
MNSDGFKISELLKLAENEPTRDEAYYFIVKRLRQDIFGDKLESSPKREHLERATEPDMLKTSLISTKLNIQPANIDQKWDIWENSCSEFKKRESTSKASEKIRATRTHIQDVNAVRKLWGKKVALVLVEFPKVILQYERPLTRGRVLSGVLDESNHDNQTQGPANVSSSSQDTRQLDRVDANLTEFNANHPTQNTTTAPALYRAETVSPEMNPATSIRITSSSVHCSSQDAGAPSYFENTQPGSDTYTLPQQDTYDGRPSRKRTLYHATLDQGSNQYDITDKGAHHRLSKRLHVADDISGACSYLSPTLHTAEQQAGNTTGVLGRQAHDVLPSQPELYYQDANVSTTDIASVTCPAELASIAGFRCVGSHEIPSEGDTQLVYSCDKFLALDIVPPSAPSYALPGGYTLYALDPYQLPPLFKGLKEIIATSSHYKKGLSCLDMYTMDEWYVCIMRCTIPTAEARLS